MRSLVQSAAGRWTVSFVAAIAVVSAVLGLFRLPAISAPQAPAIPAPQLILQWSAGKDGAVDEKNLLTDPTPLFLPTKWNATQRISVNIDAPRKLGDYPPSFSARSPDQILPPPVEIPAPLDSGSPMAPLHGFGRHDVEVAPLPARGAFLEIVAEGTGRKVLNRALPDAAPPAENGWQSMEFLVGVDDAGLIATLEPTKLSGSVEVDRYFQRYLAQTLRAGQRLAPGFYRITVGP